MYDADGNLLIRRDPGQTTLFVADTEIVVNTSVSPATVVGAIRTYTLGQKPVAMASSLPGGGVNYLFTDQQGTGSITMDTTTQKVVRKQQTPYGQPRGTASGWPDPTRGFLNKPVSTSTGYTDVGARTHDPTLGRFLSVDPVFDSVNLSQLGGYAYAGSNPVTGSDPSGLYCDGCDWDTPHGNLDGKTKPDYSSQPCASTDFVCVGWKLHHPTPGGAPQCGEGLVCHIHNHGSSTTTTSNDNCLFCLKYGPYVPKPPKPAEPPKQTVWEGRFHTDPAKGAEPVYSDSPNPVSRWFHRGLEALNTPAVALSSGVIQGVDVLSGADCKNQYGMIVCSGGWGQYLTPGDKSGITLGFVYVSKDGHVHPEEMHHESVHRRQFLDYGIVGMAMGYFGQAPWNGFRCNNTFEQEAGLKDGSYTDC